jgi:hypothetical protein
LVRYWTWRASLTARGVAPLLPVGLAWSLNRWGLLDRFHFYLAATAAICSGLFDAWGLLRALEPYYPRYPAFTLAFYYADRFALADVIIPLVVCVKVLRLAPVRAVAAPDPRAASALHGQSDWLPIERARRRHFRSRPRADPGRVCVRCGRCRSPPG